MYTQGRKSEKVLRDYYQETKISDNVLVKYRNVQMSKCQKVKVQIAIFKCKTIKN